MKQRPWRSARKAGSVDNARPPRPPPPPQRLSWRPLPLAVSAFPARAPSSTATAAFVEAPAGGDDRAPQPPPPSLAATAAVVAALAAGGVGGPRLSPLAHMPTAAFVAVLFARGAVAPLPVALLRLGNGSIQIVAPASSRAKNWRVMIEEAGGAAGHVNTCMR